MGKHILPSIKYHKGRAREAYELALLGHTEKEMAAVMQVSDKTIELWKNTHVRFLEALRKGKDIADAKVATSLYKRAVGYSYPDIQVSVYKGEVTEVPVMRHVPPDTNAAIKWLEFRQGKRWSKTEKMEITNNIRILKIDLTGFSAEELQLAERLGLKQADEARQDRKSRKEEEEDEEEEAVEA